MITFILPSPADTPSGGYKVVYEYANRLVNRGYQIAIGFDCRTTGAHYHFPEWVRRLLARVIGNYRCMRYPRWFHLDTRIHKFCVFTNQLPKSDYYIATAYHTTELVTNSPGKWLYLIQDFENWDAVTDDDVYNSYRKIDKRIVIAKWLLEKIESNIHSGENTLIYNGLDSNVFFPIFDIEERYHHSIAMLYHPGEYKGARYGIEVIKKVKDAYPDLKAIVFGVPQRPDTLPEWIDYRQNVSQADLNRLYNASTVVLLPSIEEGFGLTGIEAMAAGCALCTSDFKGAREYAINNYNALVSPPKDVDKMVENVKKVFESKEIRNRLSEHGMHITHKFNWESSIDKFIHFMKL